MIANGNNLIAVEWDRDELRYLWAGKGPRRLVIRAIGRIDAADLSAAGELEPTWESLLAQLKRHLRAKGSRATVVLPRGEIESFDATFPPATDHELSSLVIHEAHKHLANADDAHIDYLEIERGADETRRLAIVALPQAGFSRIHSAVKHQGWKLESLQVRHVAAAGLIRKLVDLSVQPRCIAVCMYRNDVELLIFEHARVILVRSISLPAESETAALAERLAVEIQRSLMVTARTETHETEVPDRVVVLGSQEEQTPLVEQLAQALQLPTQVVNPVDAFVAVPKKLPEQLHHFSGLVGALVEQPAELTIDLQDSKCIRPQSRWLQRTLVYGAVAVLAVAGLIWWALDTVAEIRDANEGRRTELSKLEKQYDQLISRVAVVDQVEAWHSDDINWLDELRELSQRFPERSSVQVKSMTLSSSAASPGIISMSLQAKNESVITQMEHTIRDQYHQVRTNQFSQSDSDQELPWQFGATVLVEPREREQFSAVSNPAAGSAPPASANLPAEPLVPATSAPPQASPEQPGGDE